MARAKRDCIKGARVELAPRWPKRVKRALEAKKWQFFDLGLELDVTRQRACNITRQKFLTVPVYAQVCEVLGIPAEALEEESNRASL